MITTAAFMILLATASPVHVAASVRHFPRVDKSIVPKSLLDSKLLCADTDDTGESVEACEKQFRTEGAVWTGDVNSDGVNELVIYPGGAWSGSGGDTYFLLQRRDSSWFPLFKNPGDWFTPDPEFDILPIIRGGYHDLRIAVDRCVKWNGKEYEDYDTNDYHNLSPSFFNAQDWRNAPIFWDIRYEGLKTFQLLPKWFVLPLPKDRSSANVTLDDPKYGLKWIALFKGGVWGVRGKQAFLLVPQPAYTGAQKLEFQGDWLVIHGDTPLDAPSVVARYNRRTNEVENLADFNNFSVRLHLAGSGGRESGE